MNRWRHHPGKMDERVDSSRILWTLVKRRNVLFSPSLLFSDSVFGFPFLAMKRRRTEERRGIVKEKSRQCSRCINNGRRTTVTTAADMKTPLKDPLALSLEHLSRGRSDRRPNICDLKQRHSQGMAHPKIYKLHQNLSKILKSFRYHWTLRRTIQFVFIALDFCAF